MEKVSRKGFLRGLAAMVGLGSFGAWKGLGKKNDLSPGNFDVRIALPTTNASYLKMRRAEAQRLYNNYQISTLIDSMSGESVLLTKGVDSDFDEYAKRYGGALEYVIGDQIVVRRPPVYRIDV